MWHSKGENLRKSNRDKDKRRRTTNVWTILTEKGMDRGKVYRWDVERKAIFRMIHEKLSSWEEALFVQVKKKGLGIKLVESIKRPSHVRTHLRV